MKKILLLLFSLVISVSLFIACSGKTPSGGQKPPETTDSAIGSEGTGDSSEIDSGEENSSTGVTPGESGGSTENSSSGSGNTSGGDEEVSGGGNTSEGSDGSSGTESNPEVGGDSSSNGSSSSTEENKEPGWSGWH